MRIFYKLKFFTIFVALLLCSCRSVNISSTWGLCGSEDPVKECEWMRKIIRQNRTRVMQIAEVVAEKYIVKEEKDSVIYEKINGLMYAYQIYCENHPNCHDCFLVTSYDCNGKILSSDGYLIGGSGWSYFDNNYSTYVHCNIIDVNIIYEQK